MVQQQMNPHIMNNNNFQSNQNSSFLQHIQQINPMNSFSMNNNSNNIYTNSNVNYGSWLGAQSFNNLFSGYPNQYAYLSQSNLNIFNHNAKHFTPLKQQQHQQPFGAFEQQQQNQNLTAQSELKTGKLEN